MPKPRLYGKRRLKLPRPPLRTKDDRGFTLRTINMADSRFHVVRQLRRTLDQLVEEHGCDTLSRRMLAARAAYLQSYLESAEVDAMDGEPMDWRLYLQVVRSLTDVLSKLGVDKATKGAKRLQDYIVEATEKKNGKVTSANGK